MKTTTGSLASSSPPLGRMPSCAVDGPPCTHLRLLPAQSEAATLRELAKCHVASFAVACVDGRTTREEALDDVGRSHRRVQGGAPEEILRPPRMALMNTDGSEPNRLVDRAYILTDGKAVGLGTLVDLSATLSLQNRTFC